MTDWFATLDGLRAQAWQRLADGVADRDAPTRLPTLATVSPDGWPESRIVVLRRAVPSKALLEVYTDSESAKIVSLRRMPRAALHVWDPDRDLQIRMQADVILTQGVAVSDRWRALPDVARLSYGVVPAPGAAIAGARDYEKTPHESRFCVLSLFVRHIDVVHLGAHHRRAAFAPTDGWAGQWLVP